METWKVSVFEAAGAGQTGKAANLIDKFAVDASSHDAAKAETKKRLEGLGRTVRSVNFSATENELVAYVAKKGSP